MTKCSVVIAARNEEDTIAACLKAVADQDLGPDLGEGIEVIIVANGCDDLTAEIARSFLPSLAERGFRPKVLETVIASKTNALNMGDAVASGEIRAYVDADVVISCEMLRQLTIALNGDEPRYASGTLSATTPSSIIPRMYARVWRQMPFARDVAPGVGLYAVNAAGRRRWQTFPNIFADDMFVRGRFSSDERRQVDALYVWPIAERTAELIGARRRQEYGVRELSRLFPRSALQPETRHRMASFVRVLACDPLGAGVYLSLTVLAKMLARIGTPHWS